MTATTVSIGRVFKDLYPGPGERIKQWVVDARRVQRWEGDTCPRVDVVSHDDNTGANCRNSGGALWKHLAHDCCNECEDIADFWRRCDPRIEQWITERAAYVARHPVCEDRDLLSSETAPDDYRTSTHPVFKFMVPR